MDANDVKRMVAAEIRSPQAALRVLDGRMDSSDLFCNVKSTGRVPGSNFSRLLIEVFVDFG